MKNPVINESLFRFALKLHISAHLQLFHIVAFMQKISQRLGLGAVNRSR
jgi:hypothetical protein